MWRPWKKTIEARMTEASVDQSLNKTDIEVEALLNLIDMTSTIILITEIKCGFRELIFELGQPTSDDDEDKQFE